MAYKRNPMRCERMAALSRFVIVQCLNPCLTASAQWFERTLDDSANKRLSISEAFLAVDAILNLYMNIADGLVVYKEVIKKHLNDEMPFMCTENIMMDCVKNGGNRQELHEHIRVLSMEVSKLIKEEGKSNDLLKRIADDNIFNMSYNDVKELASADKYIGRAIEQTQNYIYNVVNPVLSKYNVEKIQITVK